jgi:hypothetical protein
VAGQAQGGRPDLVDVIRGLEPFQGGRDERLWCLDYLDVADKHHLLILVGSAFRNLIINPAVEMRKHLPADWPPIPDMPIALLPADRMFPLKDGDELYSGPREAKPEDYPAVTYEIALGQPGFLKGFEVMAALASLRQAVVDVVDEVRARLL